MKRWLVALGLIFGLSHSAAAAWNPTRPAAPVTIEQVQAFVSSPISVSITPSRTIGVAPLAVFFDASLTTDSAETANPIHDLDYRWSFGDANAGTWSYGSSNSVDTPGGGMSSNFTGFIDDGTGGGAPSGVAGKKLTVTALLTGSVQANGGAITGTNVAASSTIGTQITGTAGQAGTYNVNNSSTTASETLTSSQTSYASAIWNTSKNFASGPWAAHVFAQAGSYAVNVTVTGPTGAVSKQVTITVQDPAVVFGGTWNVSTCQIDGTGGPVGSQGCTVCLSPAGTYTGCPSGGGQDPKSACGGGSCPWPTVVSTYAGPVRILMNRGETFTSSSGSTQITSPGPGDIGSYGSGAQPIVRMASGSGAMLAWSQTNIGDWRIHDVEFDCNSLAGAFTIVRNTKQILIQNVTMVSCVQGFSTTANVPTTPQTAQTPNQSQALNWTCTSATYCIDGLPDQIFVINTSLQNLIAGGQYGAIWTGVTRLAVMGNDWENATLALHIDRTQFAIKAVTNHNYFARAFRSFATFLIHGDPECTPTPPPTCFPYIGGQHVASENVLVNDLLQSENSTINPQAASPNNEPVQDVIYERNMVVPGSGSSSAVSHAASKVSVRLNIFNFSAKSSGGGSVVADGLGAPVSNIYNPAPDQNWFYNNSMYCPNNTGASAFLGIATPFANSLAAANLTVKNTLMYCPLATAAPGSTVAQFPIDFTGQIGGAGGAVMQVTGFVTGSGGLKVGQYVYGFTNVPAAGTSILTSPGGGTGSYTVSPGGQSVASGTLWAGLAIGAQFTNSNNSTPAQIVSPTPNPFAGATGYTLPSDYNPVGYPVGAGANVPVYRDFCGNRFPNDGTNNMGAIQGTC